MMVKELANQGKGSDLTLASMNLYPWDIQFGIWDTQVEVPVLSHSKKSESFLPSYQKWPVNPGPKKILPE